MHVRTEVTELIAHTDRYTYRAHKNTVSGKWSIVRKGASSIWIPPLMELMTSNRGWVCVTAVKDGDHVAQFDTDEAALMKAFEGQE